MKYKPLTIVVFLLLISSILFVGYTLMPYISHNLISYGFKYPDEKEALHIHTEASPAFINKILQQAFFDRDIIYNDYTNQPHLRVIAYSGSDKSYIESPYITFSGEPKNIAFKKLLKTGLPFIEFTSLKSKNNKEIYIPFIAWSDIKPKKICNKK